MIRNDKEYYQVWKDFLNTDINSFQINTEKKEISFNEWYTLVKKGLFKELNSYSKEEIEEYITSAEVQNEIKQGYKKALLDYRCKDNTLIDMKYSTSSVIYNLNMCF